LKPCATAGTLCHRRDSVPPQGLCATAGTLCHRWHKALALSGGGAVTLLVFLPAPARAGIVAPHLALVAPDSLDRRIASASACGPSIALGEGLNRGRRRTGR